MPLRIRIPLPTASPEEVAVARLHAIACRLCDRDTREHHADRKPFSITPAFDAGDFLAFDLRLLDDARATEVLTALDDVRQHGLRLGERLAAVDALWAAHLEVEAVSWDQVADVGDVRRIRFDVLTPTGFRRGNRALVDPSPGRIFAHLRGVWNAFCPPELRMELDLKGLDLELSQFDLRTEGYEITRRTGRPGNRPARSLEGFVGWLEVDLSGIGPDQRSCLGALASLASLSGVGTSTTAGMGVVEGHLLV